MILLTAVTSCCQEPLRDSVARFMAHVHTAVNQASRQYLQSDRRYNYTTPKSFLEQISLYSRLLTTKNAELAAKVARLENGLDKLRSTAAQVDDLKAKLAVQEVELKQKNEAADALIEIVGVETEKVSTEKAVGESCADYSSRIGRRARGIDTRLCLQRTRRRAAWRISPRRWPRSSRTARRTWSRPSPRSWPRRRPWTPSTRPT